MCFGSSHRLMSFIALSVVMSLPAVALAQNAQPSVEASEVRSQGHSLSEAVRHVQRTTGGRILGAERVPFDGRDINRVKYMDDRGRVRYMDAPVNRLPERSRADSAAVPRRDNH